MLYDLYGGCHERHVGLLDVIFSLPWAMKKRIWAEESIGFRMKCAFLLLCVLKRSLSVVFAIMCRYILLRNRGIWMYIARVVKYYGICNVCTEAFYYDVCFWRLVSHFESFEFQYWRCYVILNHDAKCVLFIMQVLKEPAHFSRSFLATEDRRIESMSIFQHQDNT